MFINLTKLITNLSNEIIINDEIELDKSYLEKTDIKDISKIKVNGNIKPFETNFELNLTRPLNDSKAYSLTRKRDNR